MEDLSLQDDKIEEPPASQDINIERAGDRCRGRKHIQVYVEGAGGAKHDQRREQ